MNADISPWLSVMQILTVGEIAKGIILKVFTPASSVWGGEEGGRIGWRGPWLSPRDCLRDDILSGPSSLVAMGECRQRTGQLFSVSICAARCLHRHGEGLFFFLCYGFISFHLLVYLPVPILSLPCMHTLANTPYERRKKCTRCCRNRVLVERNQMYCT